jgi:hypothetical protein
MKIQLSKYRCDCCGKEVETEDGGLPVNWLTLEIVRWGLGSGTGLVAKELCSDSCMLNVLADIKEIPNIEEEEGTSE